MDEVADAADAMIGVTTTLSRESDDLKNNSSGGGVEGVNNSEDVAVESDGNEGATGGEAVVNWQNARSKAEILAHPLYEQLLSAHVACLRIATPVDQLPRIDSQLAQSQNVAAKYSSLGHGSQPIVGNGKELDQFMVCFFSCLSMDCLIRWIGKAVLFSELEKDYKIISLSALCKYLHLFIFHFGS